MMRSKSRGMNGIFVAIFAMMLFALAGMSSAAPLGGATISSITNATSGQGGHWFTFTASATPDGTNKIAALQINASSGSCSILTVGTNTTAAFSATCNCSALTPSNNTFNATFTDSVAASVASTNSVVGYPDPNNATLNRPTISGTAVPGQTLTCVNATTFTDVDGDVANNATKVFQWYNGTSAIAGANTFQWTITAPYIGALINCEENVTATNWTTSSATNKSLNTTIVSGANYLQLISVTNNWTGVTYPIYVNGSGKTVQFNVTVNNTDGVNNVTRVTFITNGTLCTEGNTRNMTNTNASVAGNAASNWTINCTINATATENAYIVNITMYSSNSETNNTNITAATSHITVDRTPPVFVLYNSLGVAEPDLFYSNNSSNQNITVQFNVTDTGMGVPTNTWVNGAGNITITYTGINGTTCTINNSESHNITYDGSSKWIIAQPCNVSEIFSNHTITNPEAMVITITVMDLAHNINTTTITPLIHNLGVPAPNASVVGTCLSAGSRTTNLSNVLNFSAINFVMEIKLNGSAACIYNLTGVNHSAPWNNSSVTVALFNYSSVDMSTAAKAIAVASAMGNTIRVQIAPPNSFQASSIYLNSSALTELNNTLVNVSLFYLPFSGVPAITWSGGTGNNSANLTIDSTWFDSGNNTSFTNLTLHLGGFSNYSLSDTAVPTFAVGSPAAGIFTVNSTSINLTVNGTGTEVQNITMNLTNRTGTVFGSYYYIRYPNGSITNTTLCANTTAAGSNYEAISCNFTFTAPATGNYTLAYTAYDYGNNTASGTRVFALGDVVPPVVTLLNPADNNATNSGAIGNNFNFSMTDANFTGYTGYTQNNCTLYINGVAKGFNTSLSSNEGNSTFFNASSLADGVYSWLVSCTDQSGNVGNSSNRTLYVDSSGPHLTLSLPLNNTSYGRAINVTYNITSTAFKNVTIRIAYNVNGSYVVNTTVTNASAYSANITVPADGYYDVNVTVYDNYARSASQNVTNVTAEGTAPTVTIYFPNQTQLFTAANATYNSSNVLLNFTAKDTFSVKNCSYSLDGGAWTTVTNCSLWTIVAGGPVNNTTIMNASLSSTLTNVNGTHIIQLRVYDNSSNVAYASTSFTVDTASTPTHVVASSGTVTIANGTTNEILTPDLSNVNVTIASSVAGNGTTSVNLTLPTLTSTASNVSATINGTLNISVTTTGNDYQLALSTANTTITGPSNWTGVLEMPTVKTLSSVSAPAYPGYVSNVTSVVEVGFGDTRLNLSSPARLLLVGMGTAQHVGYAYTGQTFTPITAGCTADTAAGLGSNSECIIVVGADMAVWTTHFTTFGTYTVTRSDGGSGSGGSGGSGGSSGGSISSGCTPSWSCGAWNTCASDGTQARTCSDANSCGVTTGKPSESQTCTYVAPSTPTVNNTTQPPATCTPNWNCGSWNACTIDNKQTRTCTDSNSCGVATGKPSEKQACTYSAPSPNILPSNPAAPAAPSTTTPASGGLGALLPTIAIIGVIVVVGAGAFFLLKPKGKKGM